MYHHAVHSRFLVDHHIQVGAQEDHEREVAHNTRTSHADPLWDSNQAVGAGNRTLEEGAARSHGQPRQDDHTDQHILSLVVARKRKKQEEGAPFCTRDESSSLGVLDENHMRDHMVQDHVLDTPKAVHASPHGRNGPAVEQTEQKL